MLAGVSTDYYIRMEQGRERRPSDQVLGALAQALRLDVEATEHLYRLARPQVCEARRTGPADQVTPDVLRLLRRWAVPVFVVNRRLDVLAGNRLGVALFEGLEHNDNLLRLTFLNPSAREFYVDWEREACAKVAHLRAMAGSRSGDPLLFELVEELSRGSADFGRLWGRHDVRAKTSNTVRLRHPAVGDLTLLHETFRIDSLPDLRVFVSQAQPGSPSERALALLAGSQPPPADVLSRQAPGVG